MRRFQGRQMDKIKLENLGTLAIIVLANDQEHFEQVNEVEIEIGSYVFVYTAP